MNLRILVATGHWPTLVLAWLYFFTSFVVWTLLGPLALAIGEDLHLSPGQRGALVAMPYLSGAALRILAGWMADRVGGKRTAIISQIVILLALLAVWLGGLPSFPIALAFGLLLGVAGASFAIALPQAGRWYPPNIQGSVLGMVGMGMVGVAVANLLGPVLAATLGWRAVFGWSLLPCALALVLYWLWAKDAPAPAARPRRLRDYWTLLLDKDAHWFCFYATVSFGGFVGLSSYFVLYFKECFGLTPARAGVMGAVCAAAGAFGRPLGGMLADRFGGIRVLQVLYVIAAAGLLAVAGAQSLVAGVVVFLVVQSALGMSNGAVFQLIPQRFGREMSLMSGLTGCGGGIGGFLTAAALGGAKSATGGYGPGFVSFAAVCVLALGTLALVKNRWRTTWGVHSGARI